nr:helix-turn-helix domain-containing protein [Roseomonas haemaphysalidis]
MPKHPSHPPPRSSSPPAASLSSAPAVGTSPAAQGHAGAPSTAPALLRQARLLSVVEVATRLAVSTKTVRRSITQGDLRVHRLGRQIRISEEDLQAFLARHRG